MSQAVISTHLGHGGSTQAGRIDEVPQNLFCWSLPRAIRKVGDGCSLLSFKAKAFGAFFNRVGKAAIGSHIEGGLLRVILQRRSGVHFYRFSSVEAAEVVKRPSHRVSSGGVDHAGAAVLMIRTVVRAFGVTSIGNIAQVTGTNLFTVISVDRVCSHCARTSGGGAGEKGSCVGQVHPCGDNTGY